MRLRVFSAIICCLIAAAVAAPLHAQLVNDVAVSVLPSPAGSTGQATTHGYREVRVALNNSSATRTHNVTLTLPAGGNSGRNIFIRSITRSIKLAPHADPVVSLWQPPLPLDGDGLRVTVDGESFILPLRLSEHVSPYYSSGYRGVFVLTSSPLADLSQQLTRRTDGRPSRFDMHRSELPIAQWSNQWLSYTRYDAVMLQSAEMQRLPVDVSEALRRYVQAGGTLIVIGEGWSVPATWGLQQPDDLVSINVRYVGLGMVVPLGGQQQAVSAAEALCDLVARNNTTWDVRPNLDSAHERLPVVEKLSIPVSGLLALIILFAIVIGPLNLWLLGRKRKRMWLLWTVPTISLITCGAIWGYSLLAEGWRGQCRTRTLTLLDQPNFAATTIGWAGYYAPLTPADGLRFSTDTEVTPLVERGFGYYGSSGSGGGRPRTIDLTAQQHLASGWVVARVPAYFMLRNTATPVRQRLVFADHSDGAVSVTNGLGVDIQRLIYVDHQGTPYELTHTLAAGEKTDLPRIPGSVNALNMLRVHELFTGNWMENFDRLDLSFDGRDPLKSGIRPFGPGMYLAQSDQPCPFLLPGLKNLKKQQHQTYILGITPAPGSSEP